MKVDAVSGAIMDAQFADPVPYRRHIPRMTKSEAVQTLCDQGAHPFIPQPGPPFQESPGLLYLDHYALSVIYKLLKVNGHFVAPWMTPRISMLLPFTR